MTNLSLVRSKDWLPALLLLPVPLLAGLILGDDLPYYIIWWLVWTLCGWIFWPLAAFFAPGRDAGYALAKILGPLLIMLTVTWFCTPGFLPSRFSSLLSFWRLPCLLGPAATETDSTECFDLQPQPTPKNLSLHYFCSYGPLPAA